ncbi:hypothetical protein PPL_04791 [Heterostelium album PN500]|uniref:Uncharacterized protein n=1 Tax=Heterostelium pallidum (strain ATCC 26659 / Pp 5 / PN500) TaxID=670386 RepID=D3B8J8_HETP5|nr:hypothetical protein PPL_04791 [Heterostelium album PN500]EFA82366.1 hypothetical protein PPL_04791 [Heterostelium album PN500]|eukprot:XP_020434483.1 hypothetical protein PPL_04791 [Heterostelium album PN500]
MTSRDRIKYAQRLRSEDPKGVQEIYLHELRDLKREYSARTGGAVRAPKTRPNPYGYLIRDQQRETIMEVDLRSGTKNYVQNVKGVQCSPTLLKEIDFLERRSHSRYGARVKTYLFDEYNTSQVNII